MPELPVWLLNLEWMQSPLSVSDWGNEAGVLRLFQPMAEGWISDNRVHGDAQNESVVRRALAAWTRMADWSRLDTGKPTDDLREFTMRLKGLLPKEY